MDAIYKSELNRDVPPAHPGEFAPLQIGSMSVWPPVVLAPMAGVTNYPFRALCRRFGAGLYVSEMITARPLVEGNQKTLRIADFGPEESPRSLQLYGVDPYYVGEATKRLVGEGRVDHIDMNFGCPVRKVTSKGGGAAIPVKPRLLAAIVRACVTNAGTVPVTIKFRLGIHADLLTFLDAGRVGEGEGCRAVGLHARTAAQLADIRRGGYVLAESEGRAAVTLLATGSEVALALAARNTLAAEGIAARVVSMPSCADFERQSLHYRARVLPRSIPVLAIEAGVSTFWRAYTGFDGDVVGIDRFGESAPAAQVAAELGLTREAVCARARALAQRGARP